MLMLLLLTVPTCISISIGVIVWNVVPVAIVVAGMAIGSAKGVFQDASELTPQKGCPRWVGNGVPAFQSSPTILLVAESLDAVLVQGTDGRRCRFAGHHSPHHGSRRSQKSALGRSRSRRRRRHTTTTLACVGASSQHPASHEASDNSRQCRDGPDHNSELRLAHARHC